MGFQTWLPSETPLPFMACLDVETPSICRVLQLCLKQRRSQEQLVEQGIMPPLKTPAAFHKQIRSLDRAQTGNLLKHKLCHRPECSELVRMHIQQETQAEPSLQATQMKLKKARLADDLNEKIAQRPGPMELVEKNILPVDPAVEEVLKGGKTAKPPDIYNFDEDNSNVMQPVIKQSPSFSCNSLTQAEGTDATSHFSSLIQQALPPNSLSQAYLVSTGDQKVALSQLINTVVPGTLPGSALVKQSLAKLPSDKSRSKRSKESKPRVKKLKYHQYIPPDQKQDLDEVPMDTAYIRLLQQQQQFLQLQILNQQQKKYNYQAEAPAKLKQTTEVQTSCSSVAPSGSVASVPAQPWHTQTNHRLNQLLPNLDEMKVAELKLELKLRSLPVSGTKTDLIERLKLYQENSSIQTAAAIESVEATQCENTQLTPPVSPVASRVSSLGKEDCDIAESQTKRSDNLSPTHTSACVNSPQRSPQGEQSTKTRSEKDKRLDEKERLIEELKRKLEQEQRLVEELKMQLEVEKQSQHGDSPSRLSPLSHILVKEENWSMLDCSSSPCLPVLIKQEETADQGHLGHQKQFIIKNHSESLNPVQTEAPILLPASLPVTALTIQLPANSIKLHTTVSSTAPGLFQTSGQMPQKTEGSAGLQQQCRSQTQPLTKSSCTSPPTLILLQPKFPNHVPKGKDPPRYEDAVKQTRCMLTAIQGPSAASQQMDDLFDVLIESGEISPFIRHDHLSLGKPHPVTASVTTLPINTVLSRPPPVVQVAQMPGSPLNLSTSMAALTSDPQLETFLDNTLGDSHTESQALKLMEELHSPEVTMEVDFNENSNMENMDWLELTLPVPGEGVNPLDLSAPVGVFSSDFLNSHELHLNWD